MYLSEPMKVEQINKSPCTNQTTTINSETLCDMFSQIFDKEALLIEIQLLKREC